jgi:HPt (histidine-containing phosphotransfer) domain-containing protein
MIYQSRLAFDAATDSSPGKIQLTIESKQVIIYKKRSITLAKDPNLIINVPKELRELIPGFMERRKKDVGELRTALTEGNFQKMKDIGHKLKGNSSGYGFDYMSRIGAEIEKEAKVGNNVELQNWINQLEVYLGSVEIKNES